MLATENVIENIVEKHVRPGAGVSPRGRATVAKVMENAAEIFREEGFSGITFRRVARESDVKLQNLQHYFASRDHLTCAAMRFVFAEPGQQFLDVTRKSRGPHSFEAILDAMLSRASDGHFAFWLSEGISASRTSQLHQDTAAELYEFWRAAIENVLAPLIPKASHEALSRLAIQIISILQGIMPFSVSTNDQYRGVLDTLVADSRVLILECIRNLAERY